FTLTTQSGCSWTASSDSSWVTITSGSSGTATGTVAYTVAANTGSGSRTATITAGGKPYAITQAGTPASCPTVSTFSGTGVYGYLEGNPSTAKWANPNAVATAKEPAGANAVFIADTDNNRIRMVYVDGSNAGQSVLIAGTGTAGYSPPGSNATTVSINGPRGLGALTNSNGVVTAIFFADTGNNMIRKLTPPSGGSGPWSIADFSGSGIAGYTDGSPGSAQFNAPQGIAVASNGTVYVADSSNSFIRALNTSGNASTYAGGPNIGMNTPVGLALSKNTGKLYVTDQGIHSIFSVNSGGAPSTRIAGSGTAGFADATGTSAKFNSPYQLAWTTTTADGEVLYIGDRQNQRIRKLVISSNSVTTYAGSGTAGFLDSTCQGAQFHTPSGIGVGSLGEVYVADSANNRIRKVQ
ncbi:MAG: BACON domain-containing protein, partial [Blastocatellia bacterium]